ncbi:MAG: NAD(P)H-quinone oxidoreductase [Oceanococcus sp.]
MMQAVEIREPGGPEVLQLCQRPIPKPGAGEVLIKVHAAGINRPDLLQRAGLYRAPATASDLPGLEVSGSIVAGDLNASAWKIGDAVCALAPGGGYAEYCCVPIGHCLPIPKGLSWLQAAALPETCFTVWSNVFERGKLSKGESLLVHGGSSGIGTTAIQIASSLGHTVYTTVGSQDKAEACLALGAQQAIIYSEQDFAECLLESTEKRGVDVILDMVGGEYLPRNIRCLADDGRLVIIGLLGGAKSDLPMAQVLLRRLTVTGSTLRPRSDAYKTQIAQALLRQVWPLINDGKIKPLIDQSFSLKDAAQAHQHMADGAHIGKIVLSISEVAASALSWNREV